MGKVISNETVKEIRKKKKREELLEKKAKELGMSDYEIEVLKEQLEVIRQLRLAGFL